MRLAIAIIALAGLVLACTVVEGPCKVFANEIYCMQGGRVSIFRPMPIADTIQVLKPDSPEIDPRIRVPPKERN